MKVLIVGAGAVGASYGFFLKRAGVEISYLIKPKHRANLESGITVYEYVSRRKPVKTHRLEGFGILDDVSKIGAGQFDAVLLTVASTALYDTEWLKSLVSNLSPKTTLIALQPGHHDQEKILSAGLSPEKLVYGTIPIMAYLAPLPGEKLSEPGIAFWVPPFSRAPWRGEDATRVKEVAEIFNRGGLPSFVNTEIKREQLVGETLLRLLVTGLERSEWSFDKFSHGENIVLVCDAALETLPILAHDRKVENPGERFLIRQVFRPWVIRMVWRFLSLVAPMDIESFFRVHFTKVEKQMHDGVDGIIEMGKKARLPTTNLILLRKRLPGKT